MSSIDLNAAPPGHNYKLTVERVESQGELVVRLGKDCLVFLLAIAFAVVLGYICLNILVEPASSPDDKKWAMSFLSAAGGGLIGYLIKK